MTDARTAADPPAVGYPPQPWALRGQLHGSVFLVPAFDVEPPPGWQLVQVAGRLVVGAVWVSYEPGGVLNYSELMATVLVRRGPRFAPHIVAIWVDSEASRDGGRALWAIPKELADFAVAEFSADPSSALADSWTAGTADGPIASAVVRSGRAAVRVPLRFSVAQVRDGAALVSPVRVRARVARSAVRWDVPDGPLAFLRGRRPVTSFTLRDFRMRFGR